MCVLVCVSVSMLCPRQHWVWLCVVLDGAQLDSALSSTVCVQVWKNVNIFANSPKLKMEAIWNTNFQTENLVTMTLIIIYVFGRCWWWKKLLRLFEKLECNEKKLRSFIKVKPHILNKVWPILNPFNIREQVEICKE